MADLLGSMRVEIVGDNSKLDKSIKTSEKKTQDYAKSNEKLAKSLKTLFSGIGFAVVAKKIFDVTKRAASLAASGEEIRSKFNAVFKDGSEDVKAWAETYASSVGRSDTQTLSFLATLQDTFVPMGIARDTASEFSKTMVELSGDLGSFNDVAQADVIKDLQSALVGNHETMRKYGVVINETTLFQEALNAGLVESKADLTEEIKIRARMNLIIAGTTDAQGDLLRTQESTTNVNAALNSQIDKTLEAYGDVVNKGILPFKTNLLKEITTINQNIKAHILRKKAMEGNATLIEELTLKQLEQEKAEEALAQALYNVDAAENQVLDTKYLSEAQILRIEASKAAAIKQAQDTITALEDEVTLRKEGTRIAAENLAAENALIEANIELASGISETTEEIDENTESLEENTEAFVNLTFQANAYENSLMDATFAHRKFTEGTIEGLEEAANEWDLYYANLQANAAQSTANVLGYSSNLFSQLGALRLADAKQETELIDSNLQTALDALDEEALGEEAYNDKVAELTKEANNEKAAIEYDAETASWKLKKLSAVASAAQAIVQGYAQLGPIGGSIAAVGTGIATGLQLAIIEQQKPVLQTFADGGIVAGQNFVGDNVPAMVNSGEMIINRADQSALFDFIKGKGNSQNNGMTRVIINLDKKPILDAVSRGTKNGTLVIDSRSVK